MNTITKSPALALLFHRLRLHTRYLRGKPRCDSFGAHDSQQGSQQTIGRIYVINLDRQVDRWRNMSEELRNIRDRSGSPLSGLTRRFSAVDARYHSGQSDPAHLQPYYSLAEQLFVEPFPLGADVPSGSDQCIDMTRQEIAVALSHVAVWGAVAASNVEYSLVLEDDVYFCHQFAHIMDKVWSSLTSANEQTSAFDLLYLSYREADTGARKERLSDLLYKPQSGMWQLSGYVLSGDGARKLLELLPVRGPVDLWINHQFRLLDVVATNRSLIDQRLGVPSTNSYSILPVLSKVGVLTREKPLVHKPKALVQPVIALGRPRAGLSALAMALSMLGYRCCSDLTTLPDDEQSRLFLNQGRLIFDAFVNIGSITPELCLKLARIYPSAKFIVAVESEVTADGLLGECERSKDELSASREIEPLDACVLSDLYRQMPERVLVSPHDGQDKWELLCRFLDCEYPADQYPTSIDIGQQQLASKDHSKYAYPKQSVRWMRGDTSPWIAPSKDWLGITLRDFSDVSRTHYKNRIATTNFPDFDPRQWVLREDTFPSNLALFRSNNCRFTTERTAQLVFQKEYTPVREYTSAAICNQRSYRYGRFSAHLKPAKVSGLVTGLFLYRSLPRQEIDIEFLGKDTTKVLLNVFYNPGDNGARMEYGYRGTPVLIELGFDAADDFHRYEIEWAPNSIRWRVDGHPIHARAVWNPTPIPHLPMELNVNLWHSRSVELVGRLDGSTLPAHTQVRSMEIFQ